MIDVCILLSGCGMYDGSEPHETILLLSALARRGVRPTCVAPEIDQVHVVDHTTGDEMEGGRKVHVEAARLSRGKIAALEGFSPGRADALVIPGGYGVGKHLMSGFAEPGEPLRVPADVAGLVGHFLAERKPVGVVSLGKLLLEAMVEEPFTEKLRSEDAGRIYDDPERRLLYTPGYLAGERIEQIVPGLEALADRLVDWCKEGNGE